MKSVLLISISLLISVNKLFSAPFDSGMVSWKQPNGTTTFIARLWGDEFDQNFKTDSGYEIRQGSDGWYYYAVKDGSGHTITSAQKVGIDSPNMESLNLPKTIVEISETQSQIESFNQMVETSRLSPLRKVENITSE